MTNEDVAVDDLVSGYVGELANSVIMAKGSPKGGVKRRFLNEQE